MRGGPGGASATPASTATWVAGVDARRSAATAATVATTASSATATPAYTPAPAPQPVVYDTMVTAAPISTASAGGNYTVKKGDTLYGIARQHYGDGKQWQKIASANPGVKPNALRVGQTIVVP